ncbi:MAG: hypothetical protein ACO2ZZ_02180 [Cyclobacteriaceae bacterium]
MIQKFLFLCLLFVFGCKNSKQVTSEIIDYSQTIIDNLGNSYEKVEREGLLLCYTADKKNSTSWRTVLVLDTTNGKLVYGPEKLNARVSWHSNRKLLIQESPEVISDKQSSESYNYVFDIDTKQKENITP